MVIRKQTTLPVKSETLSSDMPRRPAQVQADASASRDTLMDDEFTPPHKISQLSDQGYHSQSAAYPSPKESFADRTNSHTTTIETLGQRAKQLVNAVNKLEGAGIEASGLPLPKIVAIGDQSAGKSSLIEAISEIKVPRAAGTCTRCPLQISLVQDPVPSWKVTVHRKYQFLGQPNPDNDFGPWQLLSQPEDVASVQLRSPEEVEQAIFNAQKAALSPTDDPNKILRGAKPRRSVEFSPDVVKIEITGPSLPTLTLYDLPGIIAQANNDDGALPKMINALAAQHIRNENTIVMLTCQVGSDFLNSNAAALVRNLRAHDRTIGVITKPDKLTEEEATQWVELLNGSFKIKHGFFVTKQPSHEELSTNISHAEARRRESEFFARNPLWTNSHFARFHQRYGTTQLQVTLAKLLAEEIALGLPAIERKIDQQLGLVNTKLLDFPAPQENPVSVVFKIIDQIRRRVAETTLGEYPNNELILAWREKAQEYKAQLADMQPIVVVATGFEDHWRTSPSDPISLDSDDEESEDIPVPGSGSKRSMAPPSTPTKRQRQTSVRRSGMSPKKEASSHALADGPKEYARKFTLEEIRSTIRDRSTSGLPSASDPRAEDALIEESVEHWRMPLVKFLSDMRFIVKDIISRLAENALQRWMSTAMATETNKAIQEYLDRISDDLEKRCLRFLDAERYKPTTFSDDILEFYRKRELAYFRDHRKYARQKAYIAGKELAGEIRQSQGQEREKKIVAVKEAVLLEDPYAAEIEVMARIRGYYNTAASCLVDSVCKSMQYEVFEGCRQELTEDLADKLGIHKGNVQEICTRLVTQDPTRENARMELETEKGKLESAKRTLREMHV